jgi:D-alanyl-D-alanine carboxypeptidase
MFENDVTAICTGKKGKDGVLVCSELVTKCPSKYESDEDALSIADLLDYGFSEYTVKKLSLPKNAEKPVKIKGGMKDTLYLRCEKPGTMIVRRAAGEKLLTECKIQKDIIAPVTAGDTVGEVNYYSGKELLKRCKITSKNTVEKMTFKSVISSIFKSMVSF